MAVLEPVHVLEQDRATGKMEITKINPKREFADLGPSGMVLYTYQAGHWFGLGGQELPVDLVPQEHRDAIKAVPLHVETRGPAVVTTCEFCGEQMNQSERDAHLVAHVRATLGAAGKVPPLESPAASPPPLTNESPTVAPTPPPPVRQRVAAA